VLYGKWRPRGFDEVVGQDHVVSTLRNALITGQVAHAYLFSGPRGTGKTTTARILAKAINCSNLVDGAPCNECQSCTAIQQGAAMDLIEMDAASNRGIDDIRELRERIAFAPSDLGKKVYLLDEVHMLTDQAWNALLKTLEEPPPHAYFILATTELQDVPATVVSRCQRFDFLRGGTDAITGRLRYICEQEGFDIPDAALSLIAKQSKGGFRDAITLLEQVAARFGNAPTEHDVMEALGLLRDHRSLQLADALEQRDLAAALGICSDVAESGIDMNKFTKSVLEELRARLVDAASAPGEDLSILVRSIAELASADFRLDPGNPVPLEVACAKAILYEPPQVVAAVGTVATQAVATPPAQGGRPQIQRNNRPPAQESTEAETSQSAADQRFLKDLYNRCSMVSTSQAAWINGSCELLGMDDDTVRLGFYWPMHMQKVDVDCRELVEEQASGLLGRKVRIEVQLLDKKAPAGKKASKGGHLAEAAKALGATPIGKDGD
jgi:DNA polymerase III subunit gamma/tau